MLPVSPLNTIVHNQLVTCQNNVWRNLALLNLPIIDTNYSQRATGRFFTSFLLKCDAFILQVLLRISKKSF